MSHTLETRSKLVYSSKQHLADRYSIRIWKPSLEYVVKSIEERIERRRIYAKSVNLIDEIILNYKETIVKRRMKTA